MGRDLPRPNGGRAPRLSEKVAACLQPSERVKRAEQLMGAASWPRLRSDEVSENLYAAFWECLASIKVEAR